MAASSLVLSHSKSKIFSLIPLISRRGYTGTSMVVSSSKVEDQRAVIKGSIASSSEASYAWAPDPLTGNYRPANRVYEIDPVELRQMLLNHKVNKG